MYLIYITAPYAQHQKHFLLTIYIVLLPKDAYGSASWVLNDTLRLFPLLQHIGTKPSQLANQSGVVRYNQGCQDGGKCPGTWQCFGPSWVLKYFVCFSIPKLTYHVPTGTKFLSAALSIIYIYIYNLKEVFRLFCTAFVKYDIMVGTSE